MSPYVGLFFDIIVLGALAASIWRSWDLSRRFEQMQADRKSFEQLISALNLAASRAETAIRTLKETAIATGDALQQKITTARGLAEEMEIIVQAGDSLAERLQNLAETSRRATVSAAGDPLTSAEKSGAQPRSRAEKELLEALKSKKQAGE